jgi:dTDP-4-amino-4,6-dideoxygalactose transaminase
MSSLALFGGPPAVTFPEPHARWPVVTQAHEHAVLELLRAGDVTYHRDTGAVQQLEQRFAELVGVAHGITTHTGTAALLAGYFALNLRPGDEVIAPAYTHLGTVFPMLHVGLRPVLCDVDPETGNIDPEAAAKCVGPRTRAIAITHQFGHACDMQKIVALAKAHDLRILEDCSHAHGATIDGKHVGQAGDVACFSLHAHKTVWGGEGGILVTRHAHVAERAALYGHFRSPQAYTSCAVMPWVETGYGLKSRIHPLAAALALVGLDELPNLLALRRRNYAHWCARLAECPGLRPLPTAPGIDRGGHFRFIAHYDRKALHGLAPERFLQAVHAEGATSVWPGWAARTLDSYRMFQTLEDPIGLFERGEKTYAPGDFPNASAFSANTLQFPPFSEPDTAIIDAYAVALAKVARHAEELVNTP